MDKWLLWTFLDEETTQLSDIGRVSDTSASENDTTITYGRYNTGDRRVSGLADTLRGAQSGATARGTAIAVWYIYLADSGRLKLRYRSGWGSRGFSDWRCAGVRLIQPQGDRHLCEKERVYTLHAIDVSQQDQHVENS